MTPVTVVLGLPGSGKSGWIERQLADRPAGARWAVLGADDGPPGDAPGLLRQPLGPGCACCALRPALARALARLLRAGPWDRLILEADGAAHPERLVAALREAPFDAALRVEAIVLLLDGRQADAWLAALDRAASARSQDGVSGPPSATADGRAPGALDDRRLDLLAAASHVVVNRPPADAPGFAARLAAAGPFGRSVDLDDGRAGAPIGAPPPARSLARWPATPPFDRRALRAVLDDWAARHPSLPVRGAWPTARAWYAWTRIPGRSEVWEVSAYCLEARLDAGPEPSAPVADAYADLVAAIDRLRDPEVARATGSGTGPAAP